MTKPSHVIGAAAAVAVWFVLAGQLGADPRGQPSQIPIAWMCGTTPFHTTDRESAVPVRFQLTSHDFPYQSVLRDRWLRLIDQSIVVFPSAVVTSYACNNLVHCEYFAPRGPGRHPGVIVLHILGGDFELSRACCRALALGGAGALFVKMPYYGPRRPAGSRVRMISHDLEHTVASMTQAVLDIRRATAWLAARDEIDPNRMGITGISLGAIVSALAAAGEPRLERVCLVLGGGNLEKIVIESPEMENIRKAWIGRTFDPDHVRGLLQQIDPLTYAPHLRQRDVLMINARHDRVIPTDCTTALWDSLGQPRIIWWDAGHYSAIMYLPAALPRIVQFFCSPAAPERPGPQTPDLQNKVDHARADDRRAESESASGPTDTRPFQQEDDRTP